MHKLLPVLLIGLLSTLAACSSSSTLQSEVQLPGETARTPLTIPPDAGERPIQTATAPQGR